MNKNKQFLRDLLAFARFNHDDKSKDIKAKYYALVSVLGHDLNGLINEDKFFSPRCSGYSKLAK